jgi:acyl-CoA hydrolase
LIGHRVATLVPDGATLQLGIGAVPDAVLGNLCGRRGLGVWSEMFSDGVLALHKAGALDPARQVTDVNSDSASRRSTGDEGPGDR